LLLNKLQDLLEEIGDVVERVESRELEACGRRQHLDVDGGLVGVGFGKKLRGMQPDRLQGGERLLQGVEPGLVEVVVLNEMGRPHQQREGPRLEGGQRILANGGSRRLGDGVSRFVCLTRGARRQQGNEPASRRAVQSTRHPGGG
jgi:hypothetical protein